MPGQVESTHMYQAAWKILWKFFTNTFLELKNQETLIMQGISLNINIQNMFISFYLTLLRKYLSRLRKHIGTD